MSKFDETLMIIGEIERAATPDAICQQLLKVTSQYGLDSLIAGSMPRPRDTAVEQEQSVFLRGWPMGWLERYVQRNYVFVDPIISRIQSDMSAFTWEEAPVDPEFSAAAQTVMGEAGDFGLNAGFAVPLITLEGNIASVSLGGERMELPPEY